MTTAQDIWRPTVHFTPPTQWMNDPCGLVYWQGRFHLFYQYNPEDIHWGPMHWGHASSTDLLHWTDHPIALSPDRKIGMAFTGSCVVDGEGLAAVYTGALPNPTLEVTLQQQCIATSVDASVWQPHGVVLENPGIADFRDPKVVMHPDSRRWIMVLSATDEVYFYSSEDLRKWRYESRFGRGLGYSKGVWECPDLFSLPVRGGEPGEELWVLVVHAGLGLPADSAGAQYIVGSFDGTRFRPLMDDFRPVDHGHDFYAAQTWSNRPAGYQDGVWIAWAAHWASSSATPQMVWRGTQTIPRTVQLWNDPEGSGYQLRQAAPPALRHRRRVLQPHGSGRSYQVEQGRAIQVLIRGFTTAVVELSFGTAGTITVTHRGDTIMVDRSTCDMGAFGSAVDQCKVVTVVARNTEERSIDLIFDRSILECFFDDGRTVTTDLAFPRESLAEISVSRTGAPKGSPTTQVFTLEGTMTGRSGGS